MGLKLVDLAQLARLAVTGRTASPPLFDVLALIGRDEVLARLRARAKHDRDRRVRLLLARHGESVWNAERSFQGATDIALSDARPGPGRGAGPRAARLSRARGLREPVPPGAWRRRRSRCADSGVPQTSCPSCASSRSAVGGLHGRRRARPGRRPVSGVAARPARLSAARTASRCPTCSARVQAAVDRIAAAHPNGDDVLIVAHGGVISVYACHLLGAASTTCGGCAWTTPRSPWCARPGSCA